MQVDVDDTLLQLLGGNWHGIEGPSA
jgi:hypothetical protein